MLPLCKWYVPLCKWYVPLCKWYVPLCKWYVQLMILFETSGAIKRKKCVDG
jgi:hypothetical protein